MFFGLSKRVEDVESGEVVMSGESMVVYGERGAQKSCVEVSRVLASIYFDVYALGAVCANAPPSNSS